MRHLFVISIFVFACVFSSMAECRLTGTDDDDDDLYLYAEVDPRPSYADGEKALADLIRKELCQHFSDGYFLDQVRVNNPVEVTFIVEKNGSVSEISFRLMSESDPPVSSKDYYQTFQTLKSKMSKWKPGEIWGVVVRSEYKISVAY